MEKDMKWILIRYKILISSCYLLAFCCFFLAAFLPCLLQSVKGNTTSYSESANLKANIKQEPIYINPVYISQEIPPVRKRKPGERGIPAKTENNTTNSCYFEDDTQQAKNE